MRKLTQDDKEKVKELLLQPGVIAKDIALKFGISKGRVSQINAEQIADLEKRNPTGEAWLIEYKDQAVLDNDNELHDPPILSSIGFVVKETNDAIYLKQIWSKTTGEHIRYSIILKSTIINKKRYAG